MSMENAGESVHLCRLTGAFNAGQRDKYQNLMCWLIYAMYPKVIGLDKQKSSA